MSTPIYEIRKNAKEVIRFEISEFMGKELINIRIWYLAQDFNTGESVYKPSQKGVTVNLSEFGELKEAIRRVEQFIADRSSGAMPEQPEKTQKSAPPPADYVIKDNNSGE